ncbi:MAG: VCBS repeat-containing protein, partial [Verrucomicrobia bacterium]
MITVARAGGAEADGDALHGEPFAVRSRGAGSTLFTRLLPERTGMTMANPYDDPRMWGERYRELAFGAIGTGVAIGDYDNDGRPDVFIVAKVRQPRLYRNLGDFRFEDVTEAAGIAPPGGWKARLEGWLGLGEARADADPGEWKQGAAFADVNNDGWLDLYVCRFAAPNLLYINRGDGTFREEAARRGLALADGSGMAAFCDYDRDGWLDVYIQTNMLDFDASPDGQPDHLFRNRGDGTFEEVSARAGISGRSAGHSATWWDYDADGWPDLYVANDFATPDRLYRNNGDG